MLTERIRLARPALLAAALCLAGALGGCTDGTQGGIASTGAAFGEASRQTFAAQIIDPAPRYDTPDPVTSGQQAAAAIERYNTDQVKKPERITTSRSSTGGGN